MKVVGARWSALSADEKNPYEELAIQDKERYEKDIEELNSEV